LNTTTLTSAADAATGIVQTRLQYSLISKTLNKYTIAQPTAEGILAE